MSNEYQTIKTKDLKRFNLRDLRDGVLIKLKERITQGYNPARPLTVIKDEDGYVVADGNHRLAVLEDLGTEEVPCVIRDEDPYHLAITCNQDEETYAPMDLFDWLDVIDRLREEGLTQEQISAKIGWSINQIKRYSALLGKVVPEVLVLSRQHQEGRGTKEVPDGTFNFTEGWFRNSGIYNLIPTYQETLIKWFLENPQKNNSKVINQADRYLFLQEAIEYVVSNIIKGADKERILENLYKGLYKSMDSVRKAVKQANEQYLEKQRIQIKHQDAFEMLHDLPDKSVDCIITDPPYNTTENEWDKFTSNREYLRFLKNLLSACKRVLKDSYALFIFIDSDYMSIFERMLERAGFPITSRIIWVRKNHATKHSTKYQFIGQWEPLFYSGNVELRFPASWGDERGDVQEYALPQSNFMNDRGLHPTQKPLELIKRMIDLTTEIGDLVVDPFCGAGTMAKACDELNRKCITCDTNRDYVDIATERVFGGKK